MAIENIIAQGIGFSPGSTKFIPTLGFTPGAEVVGSNSRPANWISPSMSMYGLALFFIGWFKWQ